MRLSAEQFYEAMAAIEAGGAPLGADRRGGERRSVLASVEVASYTLGRLGPERSVMLNDLAAGGVSMTVDEPVTAGERFFLRLPSRDGRPPLVLLCAVRNCRSTADGFRVGAAFLACGEGSIADVCRRLPEAA